jgi:hypothetical protein
MKALQQNETMIATIQKQLLKVGVVVKNIKKSIHFDSEQACQTIHDGQWADRLALSIVKQKPNARRVH